MSKNYTLKADVRDGAGKGIARALRRENKTPAVIYGDGKEPLNISLDQNTINVEYNRAHMFTTLCDVEVGNDKHLVLARDVQLHPVSDNVMHVDFLRVTAKTRITVDVPLNFINQEESPGIREKGVLNIISFELPVSVIATNIPDQIDVDLTGKDFGDSITLQDATLPEGATPITEDEDMTLAVLNEPKKIEEIEAEEAAEAAADAEGAEGESAEGAEGAEGEGGDAEKAEGGDEKSE